MDNVIDLKKKNGHDDGPLAGWSIVLFGGRGFIGKRETPIFPGEGRGVLVLSPVYDLLTQQGPTPQGGWALNRIVGPVLTLVTVERLEFPESQILTVACETLGGEERQALAQGVAQADAIVRSARAQMAGITIAAPGAKLPPPPGGRR